jgi:hypothetical protein
LAQGTPNLNPLRANNKCSHRLPKNKYAERVAAKHPVMFDKRFIHPRAEQKED